jgi:hypothetical protein
MLGQWSTAARSQQLETLIRQHGLLGARCHPMRKPGNKALVRRFTQLTRPLQAPTTELPAQLNAIKQIQAVCCIFELSAAADLSARGRHAGRGGHCTKLRLCTSAASCSSLFLLAATRTVLLRTVSGRKACTGRAPARACTQADFCRERAMVAAIGSIQSNNSCLRHVCSRHTCLISSKTQTRITGP